MSAVRDRLLRHVPTLGEVFLTEDHAFPEPVEAMLRSAERPIVVALGADVGYFGVPRRPDARVVAVEPDPSNVAVLRDGASENAGDWQVLEACAAARSGDVDFEAWGWKET